MRTTKFSKIKKGILTTVAIPTPLHGRLKEYCNARGIKLELACKQALEYYLEHNGYAHAMKEFMSTGTPNSADGAAALLNQDMDRDGLTQAESLNIEDLLSPERDQ